MRQPEIKEAVLRGAVPLQLYRVVADHAPEPRATIRHMQLTAVKRADAQLQHRVQVYTQEAQQTSHDRRTYYNLLIHYQHAQPSNATRTGPRQQPGTYRSTAWSARAPSPVVARSSCERHLSSGCQKVKHRIHGRGTHAGSAWR